MLWYNSANRDEDVFDDPYRFDVARTPNEHVGFGGPGPHFCLGAHLARREITVMFRELFRRLPDLEITGEPRAAAVVLHQRHQAHAVHVRGGRRGRLIRSALRLSVYRAEPADGAHGLGTTLRVLRTAQSRGRMMSRWPGGGALASRGRGEEVLVISFQVLSNRRAFVLGVFFLIPLGATPAPAVEVMRFNGSATDIGIQREPGGVGGVEYRIRGEFDYDGPLDLSTAEVIWESLLEEVGEGASGSSSPRRTTSPSSRSSCRAARSAPTRSFSRPSDTVLRCGSSSAAIGATTTSSA